MNFPLYDDLLKQVNELGEDKKIDITRVCYTINNIYKNLPDKDAKYHYKKIGYLMIHHSKITDNPDIKVFGNQMINRFNMMPYNSQIMMGNKGILSAMENLPPLLQKIITQYVENFSF